MILNAYIQAIDYLTYVSFKAENPDRGSCLERH